MRVDPEHIVTVSDTIIRCLHDMLYVILQHILVNSVIWSSKFQRLKKMKFENDKQLHLTDRTLLSMYLFINAGIKVKPCLELKFNHVS